MHPLPLLGLLLAAQEPAPQAPAQPLALPERVAIHPIVHDDAAPQYWARGRDYKVDFTAGMTFVPYLGSGYPHNQPFGWRTTSVRRGNDELLAAGETPRVVRSDFRAEYRHAGFVEAYDVLAEGLEQTFVLPAAPRGEGDLVIRGAVQTRLAAPVASDAGLDFADDAGNPILRYGRATAIDADGRQFAVATQWRDGQIELRLASADVAAAHFPLVVDPLLTRFAGSTIWATYVSVGADVATAQGAHARGVLMPYQYAASAADNDLFVYAADSAMTGELGIFADSTTEDSLGVRAAYVAGTGRWVIVWEAVDAFGVHRIRTHVHTVDDNSLGSVTRSILNVSGVHDWRPDVGGTMAGSTPNALVVFQRETTAGTFGNTSTSAVMCALLDTSTTYGTFQGVSSVSGAGNFDNERPSVTRQADGGAAFGWLVAAQQYNNSLAADDWDVVVRRVSGTGALAAGVWTSDVASLGRHQLGPVVEGHGGHYAVLFSTVETAVGRTDTAIGRDLRIDCFDWAEGAASPSLSGAFPAVTLYTNANRVLSANGLSYDAHSQSHWLATFRAEGTNLLAGYAARCGYTGQPIDGPTAVYNALGEEFSEVATAYETEQGRFLMCYLASSTTNSRLYAHVFEQPAPAPASTAGLGCANATIGWSGPAGGVFASRNQLVGDREVGVLVSSSNGADLHFLVAALGLQDVAITDPIVAAGCRLLVPASGASYIGTLPLQIGALPRWTLALPEGLGSVTLRFQDWIYDPAANVITSTSRLTVPILR